ncbi:Ig-like domain-containing protein [Chitinophaga agrisoli]|uniref:Ig-like domain-containing protein n=1 Tax=Chitinophaga agrisoli TaxID=2607653 RepID=UPI001FE29C18|nr:Ig-like domain-containing protein [Chitinophaga agrisoli]
MFNLSAVNDAPIAVRDSVGVTEDVAATGNVLTNDSDPEGDGLTASLVTAPVNGTVVLNSDGSFTYTPNGNYNGLDSLSYQVCDNGTPSLCDTASLVFNVSAVNDAPIAVRDSVGVTEDVAATGNVLTNDSDPEGDGLTASLVTAPVNGTVVLNSDDSFTYTPNGNYNGLDSLSYQVCDNGTPSLCDTASLVFNVSAVNDAPIAVRDSITVTEDIPATGNVLANDSDPEGDGLTASLVTAPVNGTVVLNSDGSFTYTPNANFNDLDSLIYQVCDNGTPSLCDTATLIFNVLAANDTPIAVRDSITVTEDVAATGNVLTNDSDPEGDGLTASLVTAPVNGTVVLNSDGSFTYTPNANFNGLDSLIYQVCDNGTPSLCDTATLIFNVLAANDAPIAVRDSITVTEDVPATGNVLTNDSDLEGDGLTASLVTAPVNGTVVLNSDGSFTYTPNANFNGLDSLIYQVCDNGIPSLCDTATLIFNVLAANDAPIAVRDSITVTEDIPATGNVLANDSDPEGDGLTASLVTAPVNGTVVLNSDGSFTYTPNANFNGLDSLIYQVCDNGTPSLCDTATLIFNVLAANDAPIAVRDSITVTEDIPATGNVLTNDSDPEGDGLTASLVTAPVNGTVVLNSDGSFTYTPNANFNGLDSLIYQVCDNGTPSLCDTATLIFNVLAANDAPIAVRDSITVTEDVPATGNVLTNDSDPEGDGLTASLVTAPVNGTVVLNSDDSFTYTPNANFNGLDSLIYQVCDNGTPSLCDTATLIFNVLAANDAPIAVRDSITVTEDVLATGNVLTNDSDPDGDGLTASLVTAPVNGMVVLNADGSFTYTPNANFNGLDSLIYQVCDNGTPSLCDTATLIFNISAANDAPIAVRDSITVTEDVPATGNVLTNDSDPEGDGLTASLVTAPVNGTVVLNADGSFTYTPNVNFNGLDSLIYQVCDNGTPSLCDTATLIFNVLAANDAPIAVRDSITVTEDIPATGNVLTNDSDPEGDGLTASLVTAPVNGTVVLNADGSFTYTPNANFNGLDSLIYQVCDNGTPSLCDTATLIFNVLAANDAPIAVRDSITVTEDVAATGNVLTNDSDPEGDNLTASLVTAPVNGTVVLNADGSFTYTPNANFSGLDSLVYQVCDNGTPSLCDTATLIFNVSVANDAPIAVRDSLNVTEDIPATGNVLTNDSDPEGDNLTASLVTAPVNGTVILNADGSFTYTPNANFSGLDSLIYRVCDNGTPSLCDTATVIFNVSAANDAPIAIRDSLNVTENTPATGNVLTNDSDPDGNNLTASLVTAPVNGTVVLNADGSFTYTPNYNYSGTDSLIYQVCDNGTPSLCDTATLIFNISAVNIAPIAVRDTINITENTAATGNVLTNDNDPDGDDLTTSLVTTAVNGTVVLNANGSFTYTPNTNYSGVDSFIYRICDNGIPSLCDTATVIINISAVNEPPIAVNDSFSIRTQQQLIGNVLTNDTDPQGGNLTASLISGVTHGTLQLNANGSFTYTSTGSFTGIDSFIYRVCSAGPAPVCDTATVYITVTPPPANSAIGAALTVNTPALQPDGSYRVTFTLRIGNYGNTLLGELQALYNLRNAFPLPVGFRLVNVSANGTLLINPAYNGTTETNLLLPLSTLDVDSSGLVTIVLDLTSNGSFGPFQSSVTVSAVDSAGTVVTDITDNGTNPDPNDNDVPNEPGENTPTPLALPVQALVGLAKAAGTPTLLINGDYQVTYTFVVRNMGNVAVNNVQVNDDLSAVFTPPLTYRLEGNVRTTGGLQANSQYNGVNNTALLADGSTVAAGASDTIQLTVVITPNKQFGTYNNSASLTAIGAVTGNGLTDLSVNGLDVDPDGDGNPDENTPTPVVLAPTRIRIPEGFSPNGDGKNDKFVIGNVGTDKISLEIYNRWGNVVFRDDNYKNTWDGKCNQGTHFGEEVPDGTYYYIIILNGTERFVNYITIMR